MPNYEMLPPDLREAMKAYVERGVDPGALLRAALSNDLIGCFRYSARQNIIDDLPRVVEFLSFELSEMCWGSPQQVQGWMEGAQAEHRRKSAEAKP